MAAAAVTPDGGATSETGAAPPDSSLAGEPLSSDNEALEITLDDENDDGKADDKDEKKKEEGDDEPMTVFAAKSCSSILGDRPNEVLCAKVVVASNKG